MSDLQCPARLYVGWPASAGDVGVWSRALQAENLADTVDLRGSATDLGALADSHRGEAVLVLVDSPVAGLRGLGEGRLVACVVDSDGVRVHPGESAVGPEKF